MSVDGTAPGNENAREPGSPHRAIAQLRLLLVAAFVLPLSLYALTAYLTYRAFLAEARQQIERTAEAAAEHASKVFATDELALDRIADHIAAMSFAAIANSAEVHDFLEQIKRSLPQAQAVGVIGPDHRILATDYAFPAPSLQQASRPLLTVHRHGDDDLFISDVTPGTRTGTMLFSVSRKKPGEGGSSGGEINIATSPRMLASYYATLGGAPGVHVTLFRTDGAVLARNPEPSQPTRFSESGDLMRAIAQTPAAGFIRGTSPIDGKSRLLFYKALGDYPIYVAASYDLDTIRQEWLSSISRYLIYGVPVTIALILVTLSAIGRARREERALAQAHAETEKRTVAEDQLREAQRLEAVGQLTGGIAHDFNNILMVIVGNLDLLSRHVTGEPGKRMIDAMQRAASRGSRLTQSLLAFARKQALRPEIVNPNRLIKEISELLRQAVGEAIDLEFTLSETLDHCRIDPAQFDAALLNLVVNARDAVMEKGRRIIVRTENRVFDEQHLPPLPEIEAGHWVAVSVIDNGEGMAADILRRVFDPFFTTKEVGRGSGLGLSQVYGFVKQSGGYVHIESQPQVGTSVHLYLPRSSEASETIETVARGEAPRGDHATILVVEDDSDVREVLAAELANFGFHVVTAANGPEALNALAREPFDLLLSDIVMPQGMRGDELAREAQRRWPALKVLLISGYLTPDLQERQSLGEFRVLQKPYRAEDLLQAVNERLAA